MRFRLFRASRARRAAAIVALCAAAAFAALAAPRVARAQGEADAPRTAADSIYARARRLVVSGNGAAGRLLVDSMVAASTPDTPAYADALYWRAALAASTDDAASDYRRLIVEYPTSLHTADALLALARLEVARGDRAAAATHLERFRLENPKHPEHASAGLLLAQISFEQNDLARGCAAVQETLREVPADAVEMRNQLQYYQPRCSAADANPASNLPLSPPVKAPPAGTKAPTDSASTAPATRARSAKAPVSRGRYTLQVAAYASKADADALAKRLKTRGLEVRVVGGTKLFRVRIGRYTTRAAATAAQAQLKARKISAFVAEAGPEDP
ncbi:MAG TPA: SPOR domain-containing protein [Gemmatimonadaceae bacterium]|nr:SPOR domain-containing protein [Gemmatimonadaceae bacterium]